VDGVFFALVTETVEHLIEGVPIPQCRTAEPHGRRNDALLNPAVKRGDTDGQVGRSATRTHRSRRVAHVVTEFFTRHVLDTSFS
jgi:hypothetical protein